MTYVMYLCVMILSASSSRTPHVLTIDNTGHSDHEERPNRKKGVPFHFFGFLPLFTDLARASLINVWVYQ